MSARSRPRTRELAQALPRPSVCHLIVVLCEGHEGLRLEVEPSHAAGLALVHIGLALEKVTIFRS